MSLQLWKVKERVAVHHDLSDAAASRENVHFVVQPDICVFRFGWRAPPFRCRVRTRVIIQVSEHHVVFLQIVIWDQNRLVRMAVSDEEPVVRCYQDIIGLNVAMYHIGRLQLRYAAEQLEDEPCLFSPGQHVWKPMDSFRQIVADVLAEEASGLLHAHWGAFVVAEQVGVQLVGVQLFEDTSHVSLHLRLLLRSGNLLECLDDNRPFLRVRKELCLLPRRLSLHQRLDELRLVDKLRNEFLLGIAHFPIILQES